MSPSAHAFISRLFSGVLDDVKHLVPSIGASEDPMTPWSNPPRSRARDAVQHAALRTGFARPKYDPAAAGSTLADIVAAADGLAETYELLADDYSRELLLRLLRFRVLGPHHVELPVTNRDFWERCERVDSERRQRTAVTRSQYGDDLHLYDIDGRGGPVRLVGHPLQVVEFFELRQYVYEQDGVRVAPEPGDVVVEAGGGWGDTALWLADEVGEEGRVFSFEFVPENLELIRRNLEENSRLRDRIELVPSPLWSTAGEEVAFTRTGPMTQLGSGGQETVEATTVDDLRESRGLDRIDFVKLDVEGVELHALRGAERTLRDCRPRVAVAVYHRLEDFVEIPRYLAGLGYTLYLDHCSAGTAETVLFARP